MYFKIMTWSMFATQIIAVVRRMSENNKVKQLSESKREPTKNDDHNTELITILTISGIITYLITKYII